MPKLNKKFFRLEQTLESYGCSCSITCEGCNCHAPQLDSGPSSNNTSDTTVYAIAAVSLPGHPCFWR